MGHLDLLRSLDIFAQLSEDDVQRVAGLLKERRISKDSVVFWQGDAGDGLYIVLSGRIKSFTTDAAGRERVLGFHSEGHSFGEMALLTGEPRPTTAQAVADSRLLVLPKDDFDDFLAHNLPAMLQMMKVTAQRQAASSMRFAGEQEAEFAVPTGKVFTVFSPKGGVGKSTVAANLAVALAHRFPESTALLDLSLTFGHATLLLNLSPKSSLSATSADVLRNMDPQEGLAYYLAVHPSSSLRVLAGALRPEEGETVAGETAKAAIDQLRRHFAYLVIDTGSNFTDPVLAALESSDRILVICSPEIWVPRDVRECRRIFDEVMHIPRYRVLYLLNHVFPFKSLSREQLESALQQELFAELPFGGDVPARAALRGEALVETQAGSPLARGIQKLAAQLAEEGAGVGTAAGPEREKKRGFFR